MAILGGLSPHGLICEHYRKVYQLRLSESPEVVMGSVREGCHEIGLCAIRGFALQNGTTASRLMNSLERLPNVRAGENGCGANDGLEGAISLRLWEGSMPLIRGLAQSR